jgi:hypothetical protein
MATGVTRTELIRLAEEKLSDSELLLIHSRYTSAYYLSGYAVELGIKACIAKQMIAEAIPDRKFVNSIYTHDLSELISVAGLKGWLQAEEAAVPAFSTCWAIVKRWDPNARYDTIEGNTARAMVGAIGEPNHGVLQWLRRHC